MYIVVYCCIYKVLYLKLFSYRLKKIIYWGTPWWFCLERLLNLRKFVFLQQTQTQSTLIIYTFTFTYLYMLNLTLSSSPTFKFFYTSHSNINNSPLSAYCQIMWHIELTNVSMYILTVAISFQRQIFSSLFDANCIE